MTRSNHCLLFCLSIALLAGCRSEQSAPSTLPILGQRMVEDGDTIWHTIRDFAFWNQDSLRITNRSYADKIYVSDFFFTSCPSICPIVKKQMLRLYDRFGDDPRIQFVSHTIDPKRDSVGTLKIYAENLGVDHDKWHFLTGPKEDLLDIANDYFVAAFEDPDAPGGFDHSGKIILVDTKRQVRGFCEGTDAESVTAFMQTIQTLLDAQGAE